MRHSNSQTEDEELRRLTPGGVSSPVRAFKPYPVVIDSGQGCRITDIDGNEYIDLCMAYGPLILGHSCPRVVKAVRDQIKKGSVFGAPSEPETQLIRKIASAVPCADMVRLACSGTEATMHAIRLARGYTKKDGLVKMNGGFHGAHDAVLVAAGSGSAGSLPASAGVPKDAVKNTYTVEYNDPGSFESLLDKRNDIAAVIMEPVLGNVGVVPPQKDYLQQMRKITENHDVLLIFDEVITGFRLGPQSAQGFFGVTPDMTTMGKIIGGGYPAGAFMGRREIMELVAPNGPVYAAGTFAGNPVSATAGLTTVEMMAEQNRYDRLAKRTADLAERLSDLLTDSGITGCVQHIASMFSIYFGIDEVTCGGDAAKADREMFGKMFGFMLNRGVYLPPGPMEVEFMSAATDQDAVNRVGDVFDDFLRSVKRE
ncbi:MAG: glutamate-1-semialdehyde 2,1-aminomutase [Methanomethylophilus sp.]|nr:glutamate-1-semialdehyde 2,1-aminomutase [Methanomethylophilus sp.]MDD4668697.1 glutamate-1-semialdehyde 2,1-aminomutase [Methanomethylophilus sp.]